MLQHRLIKARARHNDDLGKGIRDAGEDGEDGEDGGRLQNVNGALVGKERGVRMRMTR